MKKLAWTTDIHLNFLEKHVLYEVFRQFAELQVDGYLITGDISEGPLLKDHLVEFESFVRRPVYFVLGNHDIWDSSFGQIHNEMRELSATNSNLVWLPNVNHVKLTDKTYLVGQDGWYDGGHGNWKLSSIRMNDWWKIGEFSQHVSAYTCDMPRVMSMCDTIANNASKAAKSSLISAFSHATTCLFATHIPPWLQVASYRGQQTDLQAQPFYISKRMGDALQDVSNAISAEKRLQAFAGHTHFHAQSQIDDKIFARVGFAQYGQPTLVDVLQVE